MSNSLIRSYLQPWTNTEWGMKGNQWLSLHQTVDAKKEKIFSPDLLIAFRRYVYSGFIEYSVHKSVFVAGHNGTCRAIWLGSVWDWTNTGCLWSPCIHLGMPSNWLSHQVWDKNHHCPNDALELSNKNSEFYLVKQKHSNRVFTELFKPYFLPNTYIGIWN